MARLILFGHFMASPFWPDGATPFLLSNLCLTIIQAEHKCSKCHVIFDDRKMMLLHKRRFHPAALNKIKSDPEASTALSIAARVQGGNSITFRIYS